MKLNFLDYRSLYIEQLFDEMSYVTSRANSLSPEETVDYIKTKVFLNRFSFCKKAVKTIKYLSSLPTTAVYLPPEVAEIAEHKFFIFERDYNFLLPLFVWLRELYKTNANCRNRWSAALNDCGNHADDETKDFLVNFSKLSGQRAAISKEEKEIIFFTAIRHWGTCELHLKDGTFAGEDFSSIVGNIGCLEGEYRYDEESEKGEFELTFLVDTFLDDSDLCSRAFSDEGWKTVKILCSDISVKPKFCDYTAKLLSFGHGFSSVMRDCVNALTDKEAVVGQRMLESGERTLVPIARFLFAMGITANKNDSSSGKINERILYELLENHIFFDRVTDFFGGIKTDCADSVSSALRTIGEQYDSEYPADVMPLFRSLRRYITSSVRLGLFESTAKLITDCFKEATADYTCKYSTYHCFCLSKEVISIVLAEYLKKYGYEGEFPHYRKRDKNYERFVSVVCGGSFFSDDGGLIRIDFSVSSAYKRCFSVKQPSLKKTGEYTVPFEEQNAENLRGVSHAQSAKIGTDCDFGAASFIYPYEGQEKLADSMGEFAVNFSILCNTAFKFAEGKALSSKYRTLRFFVSLKNKRPLTILAKTVPIFTLSAALSVINFKSYLSPWELIKISLLTGGIFWLIAFLFKWLKDICSADEYD